MGDVDGGFRHLFTFPDPTGSIGYLHNFQGECRINGLFHEGGFTAGLLSLCQRATKAAFLDIRGGGHQGELFFGTVDLEEDNSKQDKEKAFGKAAFLSGVVALHLQAEPKQGD